MEVSVKRKAVIHQKGDGRKRDEFIGIRNLRIRRAHLEHLARTWHENTPVACEGHRQT